MPLLTLTSDFGSPDYISGAVKGTLYGINPAFQIADISHNISPFNYAQAAYICNSAFKNFPEFSYHLVLVNLFENNPKQVLLAFHENQYLLCPDNGLLTMILEEKPEMLIGIPIAADLPKTTLNIAKLMGETVSKLVSGQAIQSIGKPDPVIAEKKYFTPAMEDNTIVGQIIHIDNFENIIVNITRKYFEEQRKGRRFKIVFKRDEQIDKISETYADVHEGEKLALFNSAGYLEIAINKGNAAGLFGLKRFSEKQQLSGIMQHQVFYQTVRVFFED